MKALVVPGNDPQRVADSRGSTADLVVLDLEGQPSARSAVADAVAEGGWSGRVAVRVNGLATPHTYRDVIEVVETAGTRVALLVLPDVQWPEQVSWLDQLLLQVERTMGLPEGGVAICAGIASAMGLTQALAVAQASDRVQALAPDLEACHPDRAFALHTLQLAASAAGVEVLLGLDGRGGSHAPEVATDQ